MEGLSFAEAERHCEEVIKTVRDLPGRMACATSTARTGRVVSAPRRC